MVTRAEREAARARADRAHDKYVQRQYGLEPGEYARMLEAQDGRCALCLKQPRRRRLAVDHDHRTGKPRALLCFRCNQFLGQWEFDPMTATLASQYLLSIAESFQETP
jgi:hypothetical protein